MFGGSQQTTGVSDLLLGSGGFSSSLGNGFGNADTTGAATSGVGAAAGGTTSSGTTSTSTATTAFDLSDFPSLGGGTVGMGAANSSGDTSANNSTGSNGLAAALRQQQQLLAHQQMLQGGAQKQQTQQQQQSNLYRLAMQGGTNGGNFNMATEDFPALPGAPPSSSAGSGGSGGAAGLSSAQSLLMGGSSSVNSSLGGAFGGGGFGVPARSSGVGAISSGGLYDNDLDSSAPTASGGGSQLEGAGLLGGSGLSGLGGFGGLQQGASSQSTKLNLQARGGISSAMAASSSAAGGIAGSGSTTGTALSGDYGLLGLLGVIRMTDADRNALALGSDLTMLGLNLGSSEHIYSTFSGPWSESSGNTKEPQYQLPMCYYMQPPALKTGHLSKFQLETLFYIFYALPKDVLQAYAAQELYTREWRYHGDLKLWFKRAGAADGITASSVTPQYLYFDINSWERRLFNGNMNQNVTSGFLTEEDVRVKFPSP